MQVLTDAQWARFEAAIVVANIRGARPRVEDRRTIEATVWRLDNGAKRRSIPAEFGDWHHAYLRFRRWAMRGVWDRIMARLVAEGEPQLAFACVDATIARAHQKASGARSGKDLAGKDPGIKRHQEPIQRVASRRNVTELFRVASDRCLVVGPCV